jgi:succinate dehydrogenase / fumarate reductase flavoprotein subunit
VGEPDTNAVKEATAELAAPFEEASGEDPYRLHADLQATMQSLVGIFRTREDLEVAIDHLAGLRARWQRVRVAGSPAYNPGWNLTFELRSMLICSEAVARSALHRRESRGAHARVDFPDTDPKWAHSNSTVTLDGEGMRITAEPLPEMPKELRGLVDH